MTLFDHIPALFSSKNSQRKPERRKFARTCRIEELEGREMLSVTPWALMGDVGDSLQEPQVERYSAELAVNPEVSLRYTSGSLDTLAPLAAASVPAVKCLKIERGNAHKPTMSTLTLNWNVAKDSPEATSYEIKVTNGLAGSRQIVFGTITISATDTVINDGGFDVAFLGATPVGKNIVYKVKIGGLKSSTTYGFEVTAMVATAKSATAKITGRTLVFPAVKCLKIERGNAHKPTISTLTLNWNTTKDRPESDTYEIKITNGLAGNRLVVLGTIEMSAEGTVIDDGGFDVTFFGKNNVFKVKIGDLQSATIYRFEVTTMSGTAKSVTAKTTGRTLVFPAVKCLKIDRSSTHKPTSSILTLNWTIPQDRPESEAYEIKVTNGLAGNRLVVYGTIKISATDTVIDDGGFDVTFLGASLVGKNVVFKVKIGGLHSFSRYGFEVTAMSGAAKSVAAKTTGMTLKK